MLFDMTNKFFSYKVITKKIKNNFIKKPKKETCELFTLTSFFFNNPGYELCPISSGGR